MTSHRVHPSAQRRWLLALFVLIITLVATACGSTLATQAAASAGRDGAPRGVAQQPLTATSDPGVAPPLRDQNMLIVADADMVIYRVGQTATAGDLFVTLDGVAVAAGEAGNMAEAGKNFLLLDITVENGGQMAQSLNYLTTSLTDTAGRRYFVEPYAGYLSGARPIVATIEPGGRLTGNRGYMLPIHAGDLIWTGEFSGQRVTFAVSTTDIVAQRER